MMLMFVGDSKHKAGQIPVSVWCRKHLNITDFIVYLSHSLNLIFSNSFKTLCPVDFEQAFWINGVYKNC